MMLTFNIAAVREVIERGFPMRRPNGGFRDPQCGMSAIDNRNMAFWLVGDHGVYLCFERRSRLERQPLVAYAEVCDLAG